MKTQIIISDQHDPFLNRAVENYLVEHQADDTISLYLWKNQQTVVIGYNQNPFSECNVRLLLEEGGHLMRRGTGGGAVYHDLGNINFSFIVDRNEYDVHKQLSVIQDALRSYELETEISGRNDLTFEGRKFSGNAFAKGTRNNLHHGTILIKTDAEKMQRYLTVNPDKLKKNGVKSVASRIINLSEVRPDLNSENIKQPLIHSFEKFYGTPSTLIDFKQLCQEQEITTTRNKIASHDYLFGRWEHFRTTKKAQFAWGGVAIDLHIDETQHTITQARIASDCLNTDIIDQAEVLLQGCSTQEPPAIDDHDEITKDIFELIFGSKTPETK